MSIFPQIIVVLLSIALFCSFMFLMLLISKKTKKRSQLMIDPSTKDQKVPIKSYLNQIDEFLYLLKFQKIKKSGELYTYRPYSMNRFYYSSLSIKVNPYYLEIYADSKLVTLLSLILETEGSSFKVRDHINRPAIS